MSLHCKACDAPLKQSEMVYHNELKLWENLCQNCVDASEDRGVNWYDIGVGIPLLMEDIDTIE
jgi:hypothetical protein